MVKQHSSISIDDESQATHQNRKGEGIGSPDPLSSGFRAEASTRHPVVDLGEEHGGVTRLHWRRFPNRKPSLDDSIHLVNRRLTERRQTREINRLQATDSWSVSIYKFPPKLEFGGTPAQQPEIVSIGPYHRGKDHLLEFEDHKWTLLDKFLSRENGSSINHLDYLMDWMMEVEERARKCYQHKSDMSSHDFAEMMLLDGCFIIVLLLHLGGHGDDRVEEDDFIFAKPWMIPVLYQDLLKMENQIPFFVLNYLFSDYKYRDDHISLPELALKVIGISFPMPLVSKWDMARGPLHLLDLVYQSLLRPKHASRDLNDHHYHPSNQSIQSVTQLRPSGVKFKPKSIPTSFLDINYKQQVLEIPTITINDYTTCLLTNCIAWEQSHQYDESNNTYTRYFTDYIAFMNFLISEPRDVAFLCADGIISRLSQDDASVASWFNNCRKAIIFNNRSSYLSQELGKLEAYYSSHWATVRRTYFSSPWSSISLFTAFLLIVCSLIQSIMSIVSYKAHPK